MGVRGLTAFLDRSPALWDTLALKPQTPAEIAAGTVPRVVKLVIDGYALLYHLYFSTNFNCVCGGQYAEFAEHCRAYIVNLQKCGFSLLVVMDGTVNAAKEATLMTRENDLIKTVRQLTTAEKHVGKKTLPPLARYAMVDVLHELNIKVALADQEADGVVAAMAKANGCCAVSKDSDLFIMDLPAGYIPVDNLELARNGSVTAKRFNRAKFCAEMGIHAGMLPLLASAVGNDYVSQGLLRPFHASLGEEDPKMPACWQTDKEASVRDLLIVRVAAFLVKQPSQDAAITAIAAAADVQHAADIEAGTAPVFKGEDGEPKPDEFSKEALAEALRLSIGQYALDPKNAQALGTTTALTTTAKIGFPAALLQRYRDGHFDSKLLNVLANRAMWCNGVVEDLDAESAYIPSRPIREAIYSILLDGDASKPVTEYIRVGPKFGSEEVPVAAAGALAGVFLSKTMAAGETAGVDARTKALYSVIGEAPKGVAANMALPAACVRFWVKSQGGVTAVELAAVAVAMLQNKEKAKTRIGKEMRPPWFSVALSHRLAALQATLLSATLLNQALLCPVKPFVIGDVYDGEWIHRFHHLQYRAKGVKVLNDQLRKDEIDFKAFKALFDLLSAGLQVAGEVVLDAEEENVMWGVSGPEGTDKPDLNKATKIDLIIANKGGARASGQLGGNFAGLLGDDDEEESDEEEEEESAPAPVAAATEAPAPAAEKKKKNVIVAGGGDDDMAKLMAEMEAVDAKRDEKKAKEKERKKKGAK
mmetsp:Transcript_52028/g.118656  ORF Transcript_52028/g.118656 Transcript_52028/m.118656 type:complete len:760 (+) Transcript_52028:30-2309(+)